MIITDKSLISGFLGLVFRIQNLGITKFSGYRICETDRILNSWDSELTSEFPPMGS